MPLLRWEPVGRRRQWPRAGSPPRPSPGTRLLSPAAPGGGQAPAADAVRGAPDARRVPATSVHGAHEATCSGVRAAAMAAERRAGRTIIAPRHGRARSEGHSEGVRCTGCCPGLRVSPEPGPGGRGGELAAGGPHEEGAPRAFAGGLADVLGRLSVAQTRIVAILIGGAVGTLARAGVAEAIR